MTQITLSDLPETIQTLLNQAQKNRRTPHYQTKWYCDRHHFPHDEE